MRIEDVCTYLNNQLVTRPEFMVSVVRTMWSLDAGDIPDDIEVYQTTIGTTVTNIIGVWNGLYSQTGMRINLVMQDGLYQFRPEVINIENPEK